MRPTYSNKEGFLQRLHPATQLALGLSIVLLSLVTGNPFLQVALIAATGLLAVSAGVFREWSSWWKLCLWIGLAALIINPLVSREGAMVIWRGPRLPVIGRLDITLEAMAYGAGMALRLSALILAFALMSLVMDPDRTLGLLKGRGMKSALVSALAVKLVPTAMGDARDILDAQRSRGLARDSGGRLEVLKSRIPLVRRLLTASLDRAVGMAEAMESRAYGSGLRTRYDDYAFGPGDYAVLSLSLGMSGLGIAAAVIGWISFSYYPHISFAFSASTVAVMCVPLLISMAVLVLAMLWKKHWLRLRT